jgi:hypothetical protein
VPGPTPEMLKEFIWVVTLSSGFFKVVLGKRRVTIPFKNVINFVDSGKYTYIFYYFIIGFLGTHEL